MNTQLDIPRERILELFDGATKVVVVCHVAPDGDALGSTLALWEILRNRGKKVTVITPDRPTVTLRFLPGYEYIVAASGEPEKARYLVEEAELVVCLDFNNITRLDRFAPAIIESKAPKIHIDHHINPDLFAEVLVSQPEKSSTCLLLYMTLMELGLGDEINLAAATCLMTGMLTDTGGLAFNANDPDIYLAMADLLTRGVDRNRLMKKLFDTNTDTQVRICSYALANRTVLLEEHRAAIIMLSKDDLEEFGYQKGDTEGLVNRPLSIERIQCSIFIRQDKDSYVKVSMRSKGGYPVNLFCQEHFGGGGHANAAGGDFHGTLDEAFGYIVKHISEYDKYLPKHE
ncbi:MAG: DHH family phosphoesterase [Muribaculaceae bacterium]|nr:DHH family phosphoesterase [Muribaculaceae bacterium]